MCLVSHMSRIQTDSMTHLGQADFCVQTTFCPSGCLCTLLSIDQLKHSLLVFSMPGSFKKEMQCQKCTKSCDVILLSTRTFYSDVLYEIHERGTVERTAACRKSSALKSF